MGHQLTVLFSRNKPATSNHPAVLFSQNKSAPVISHQLTVLFSQNKPATSNQPAVLFSQNKSTPVISHQPNEQAGVGLVAREAGVDRPVGSRCSPAFFWLTSSVLRLLYLCHNID
jgi:hypothetical protein